MSYRKFQTYFFITFLAVSAGLTLWVFWPYLVLLAFGGVLAILSRPIYSRLLAWIRSEVAAAFLTVVIVAVAVLAPMAFFFASLSSELVGAVGGLSGLIDAESFTRLLKGVLPASLHEQIPLMITEGARLLSGIAATFSTSLIDLFSNLFIILFGFMVVLICAYYLLKDGAKVKKELLALSPLGDEYDQQVFDRIVVAVRAVMVGVLVLGLLKGVIASIAFWAFGIDAPVFWGTMTGFASFVPVFGTALITVPVIIYLFLVGKIGAAIALTVISVGLIGTVDNFLQPKLVQSKTQIHPLLILLSILGGLQLYGFAGFVLGPLTLAVTIALIDIYKKEFRNYIDKTESGR